MNSNELLEPRVLILGGLVSTTKGKILPGDGPGGAGAFYNHGDKRAVVALADTETGEVFKTSFIRQIEVDEEQFTKLYPLSYRH